MSGRETPEWLVAEAAAQAVHDGRWECADLWSRRPRELVPDLLRARAVELAGSAVARNQLLSLALDAAATHVEHRMQPLAAGALFFLGRPVPTPAERLQVRSQTLTEAGSPVEASDAAVREIEAMLRPPPGGADADRPRRLATEAQLQLALWDDPRIPASAEVRRVMLCTVPKLQALAEEAAPAPLTTLGRLARWSLAGAAGRA